MIGCACWYWSMSSNGIAADGSGRPVCAGARRPKAGTVHAGARTGRPVSSEAMIRIAITQAAFFEAIASTLPFGSW